MPPDTDRLYFKQVLAGKMANFVYLIGDNETKECVIVDPAWDVRALIDLAAADDMKVTGALVTHYHPDHVGGEIFGMEIDGLATLMEVNPVKVHVHKDEAEGVKIVTGVSETDMAKVESGDTLKVGEIEIRFIHTPGHTPGSQCFIVDNRLVSGDTLFIGGCGRVDLPGGDPAQLYESLTTKLAALPDDTVLFPGHDYGGSSSTIGREKESNVYMTMPTLDDWLRLMGR